MVAGLNLQINIWRMTVNADDSVGGALVTGTVAYTNLNAAITPRRPSQLMLEQGLETDAIYDLTSHLKDITLYERDEVEVVHPSDHPLYGLRFRIVGVQPSRRRPKHGHQHCTLSRIRESRSQQ
jgi:hypothetical protein